MPQGEGAFSEGGKGNTRRVVKCDCGRWSQVVRYEGAGVLSPRAKRGTPKTVGDNSCQAVRMRTAALGVVHPPTGRRARSGMPQVKRGGGVPP